MEERVGFIQEIRQQALSSETLPFDLLTDRQQDVLKLVAEGKTTCQIAEETKTSLKTVECHRQSLRNIGLWPRITQEHNWNNGVSSTEVITALVQDGINYGYLSAPPGGEVLQLAPEEQEVLEFLLDAKSQSEMADLAGVAKKTIESRLNRAYGKLGLEGKVNRYKAIAKYTSLKNDGLFKTEIEEQVIRLQPMVDAAL